MQRGQALGSVSYTHLDVYKRQVLAVTLHNIPEGMAVGVVYAGYLAGTAQITAAGALALSLGIAIQKMCIRDSFYIELRADGTGETYMEDFVTFQWKDGSFYALTDPDTPAMTYTLSLIHISG